MTIYLGPEWCRLSVGGMIWNRELRWWPRIHFIGTIPAFGWNWDVGGRSLGIQISFNRFHFYLQFFYETRLYRRARKRINQRLEKILNERSPR